MPAAPPLELLVRRTGAAGFTLHRVEVAAALRGMRPRPLPAELSEADGGWVLRGSATDAYLRLGPEEHYLWTLMDGRTTLEELALAWFLRFGSFDFERIRALLGALRRAGLVEVSRGEFLRVRVPARLAREVRWTGVDEACRRAWAVVGPALSGPWLAVWAAVAVLGGGVYATSGAGPALPGWVALVAWAGAFLLHAIPHEASHALSCVAFGRRVRAVGLSLRGVYVDTTDMYRSTRARHAAVALAGPAANLVVAGVAGLVVGAGGTAGWVAARIAEAGWAMAFLTGWPFLLAGDGYHALGDLLGEPRLRRGSWRALARGTVRWPHAVYLAGVAATAVGFGVVLLAR